MGCILKSFGIVSKTYFPVIYTCWVDAYSICLQITDMKFNLEKVKEYNKLKYKGEDLENSDKVVTKCYEIGMRKSQD